MKTYNLYIAGVALAGMVSCTSLSEGQERQPSDPTLTERVTLRAGPGETLGSQMNEQASEINRKRNIEEFNRNQPATTPNVLRPRQLPYAPIDSSRHNIYTPYNTTVPPIPPPPPAPATAPVVE